VLDADGVLVANRPAVTLVVAGPLSDVTVRW
jgi:hypothetical protein